MLTLLQGIDVVLGIALGYLLARDTAAEFRKLSKH
jgi:hypothetical protein